MGKLTVYFTVTAVVSILVGKANGAPAIDIQNLLQSLQQQIQQEQERYRPKKLELVEDVDESVSYGSLNAKDLSRLLGLSAASSSSSSNKYKSVESRGNNRDIEEYLLQRRPQPEEKLIPNNVISKDYKPNREIQERSSEEDDSRDDDNTNGYSKVYVVLNSDAIKKTKNKDQLNTLLSSLLSSPSDRNDRVDRKDEHRYKGFLINEDAIERRLGGRDSSEIYAKEPVMMMEKERPMRIRESRGREGGGGHGRGRMGGGGGGGSGGRTAIPYIRQRGDIYERDD